MAVTVRGKKKKLKPIEIVEDDFENITLSKADFVAKKKKKAEIKKKTEEYKRKLMLGDDAEPTDTNEVEVLEAQLRALVDDTAAKEALSDTPEAEKVVKDLKKKIVGLKMKIGKAKKALKK